MRLTARALLLPALCCLARGSDLLQQAAAEPRAAFAQWAQEHNRNYNAEQEPLRFATWAATLEHVLESNARPGSHEAGLTEYADWTDEEFSESFLGQRSLAGDEEHASSNLDRHKHRHHKQAWRYENSPIPESVDWTKHDNVVGPVKNQHVNGSKCGCCWSFAAIGVAECLNNMANNNVTRLSEQQLIDCDRRPPYSDEGCEGGEFVGGLHYIIRNHGIDDDTDYPYEAKDDKCQGEKERRVAGTIDGVEEVPKRNETALMQAVAHHPVGVALCVGPSIQAWRAYKSGVFNISGCHKPIDHGMVVVGYGSENGQDYWLLKNSWGEDFGSEGFMKLPRGLHPVGDKGWGALAGQPAYPLKRGVQLPREQPSLVLPGQATRITADA